MDAPHLWPVPAGPIVEMTCSREHTSFCLWSPMAQAVCVNLYDQGQGGKRTARLSLEAQSDGTWTLWLPRSLIGKFYTFSVTLPDGRTLGETPGIFAKAVGVNGQRAQVIDMRTTDSPNVPSPPSGAIILYEMHYRDFTIDPSSGIRHRGKYLGLTERGTTNGDGQTTGLDHLVELGVTHVHLLPSYDYGSVDETRLDTPQYNWGYDPVNYNVPEGSYCTDPYRPELHIREFKQMVAAMHEAGLRVVMDVVYNHVYDLATSNFEKTAPGYFFRLRPDGTPANGSGCGNETASERPMMRKFMVESVLYWIREYHIDGFRFDLMALHDIGTMNAIRRAVNDIDPSILIYGEGWAAEPPALPAEQQASKANITRMPGIAAFGDELRDALRGPWNDDRRGAFLIGEAGHEEAIRFGLAGAAACAGVSMQPWALSAAQMVSYVSSHDDLCLADRLRATLPRASTPERKRLQKLAYTAVLTGRGLPFLWCGDEIMRHRHGRHNCYNAPDSINAIPWRLKSEHRDLFDYIRGLIRLRRSLRFYRHDITFLPAARTCVVAYHYAGEVVVILNSNRRAVTQTIPEGTYLCVAHDGVVEPEGLGLLTGQTVKVPAQSAVILLKQ